MSTSDMKSNATNVVVRDQTETYRGQIHYHGVVGVQLPTPSFGGMIFDGQSHLQANPWLCLVPGIAVFLLLGGIQILSQVFTVENRRRPRPGADKPSGGLDRLRRRAPSAA